MIASVIRMNQMSFMDRLFNDPNILIKDLHKGLTNHNFLLQMSEESYVLRTPSFDSEQIVDRHHETLALQAISGHHLDVETIYYDEASGYKVTRYVKDGQDYNEYQGEDKLVRTAKLMKRFHTLHLKSGVDFDPIQQYLKYKKQGYEYLYDLTPYEDLLSIIASLHYDKVLCHNDWVAGNILFSKEQTYLIDYEYAGDNDPLFDVMSFLTENNIKDPKQRALFYETYFDSMDEELLTRLNVWEAFHNFLWCMWAMMMWNQRRKLVYKTIAKEKYVALTISYPKIKKKSFDF